MSQETPSVPQDPMMPNPPSAREIPASEPPLSRPVRRIKRLRRPHRTKLDSHSEGAGEIGPIGRERGGGRGGQH